MSTTPTPDVIDLDASRREAGAKPVLMRLAGTTYELPPELPLNVFSPLRGEPLAELVGLLASALDGERLTDTDWSTLLSKALTNNPRLPLDLVNAIRECARLLFGDDSWDKLLTDGLSVRDIPRLVPELWRRYGVSLGEVSASLSGSGDTGRTSRPPQTPGASMPAVSG